MRALVWRGDSSFRVEEWPRPRAGAGQVVVQVEAAAICGSDFHLPDFGLTPPVLPGHEVAGTVAEVGPRVTRLAIGDRVALDPVQRCGQCWCCRHDLEHLCQEVRHLGNADTPGGWAEYVAIDAVNAHVVPQNVSLLEASLTEPLAVCYESFQRAGLAAGQRVLIIGDGPFGFLHAQLAKHFGASVIVVAGHHDARLARIAAAGGIVTCNTHRENVDGVLAARVGPPGVDLVIEASGAAASPNVGLRALRPRGTLVAFSYVWRPEPLDLGLVHMRELNVLGSCRSHRAFDACLQLMAERAAAVGALVDLELPLEAHAAAFDRLRHEKPRTWKGVFRPGSRTGDRSPEPGSG